VPTSQPIQWQDSNPASNPVEKQVITIKPAAGFNFTMA